jgi:hypothetical protein
VTQAQESLERLIALSGRFSCFVPGHGPAVSAVTPIAEQNRQRIRTICDHVQAALREPAEGGRVLASVAETMGVSIPTPAIYYLTLTTIHSCLSALQAAGEAELSIVDNRALWQLRPTIGDRWM